MMNALMANNIRYVWVCRVSYGYEWASEVRVPFAKFSGISLEIHDFHNGTCETEDEAYDDAADWLDKVELGLDILNDKIPNRSGVRTWTVKRFDDVPVLVLRETEPGGDFVEQEIRLDSPELEI